jgi:ubiquinone/menaquinone biosynthesis C-methylase UbiE
MGSSFDDAVLLDVGGPGLATVLLAARFEKTVAVNLDRKSLLPDHISAPQSFHKIIGDGCNLPLADNSVDFAFSDNVIEHVREREKFVGELRRVARKGFLLTTPNFWFPLEPHYRMPFLQFLPQFARRWLLRSFSIGFFQSHKEFIRLLTASDLKALLPGIKVEGLALFLWPETLVAWYRK